MCTEKLKIQSAVVRIGCGVAAGAAVVLLALRIYAGGAHNASNFAFQGLAQTAPAGKIWGLVGSPVDAAQLDRWAGQNLNACQSLWLSQIAAEASLQLSQTANDHAAGCLRRDLAAGWSGLLAWLQRDEQTAMAQWSQLPPATLVQFAQRLAVTGYPAAGRLALMAALAAGDGLSDPGDQARLYITLGNAYRLEKDWPNAVVAYARAVQAGPGNPETIFYLGQSLCESGRPEQAIEVLEGGRPYLEARMKWFAPTYLTQLGLAYMETGNRTRAYEVFSEIWEAIQDAPTTSDEQRVFIKDLLRRTAPAG